MTKLFVESVVELRTNVFVRKSKMAKKLNSNNWNIGISQPFGKDSLVELVIGNKQIVLSSNQAKFLRLKLKLVK